MKWILCVCVSLFMIACSSSDDPYHFVDEPSTTRIIFPAYPFTQSFTKNPYKRLVELRFDSSAFFLNIICRPNESRQQMVDGSRMELGYQMHQQGFAKVMERDTLFNDIPVYECMYNDETTLLHHYILIKDSFVIHPSVLMLNEAQLVHAANFFNSLHFGDSAGTATN